MDRARGADILPCRSEQGLLIVPRTMTPSPTLGPVPAPSATAAAKPPRDFRLDFFRGLALVFIFVDHIPNNVVSWLTVRNFGLSDATEIFIFISGYSAMLAYGASLARRGFLFASAQVLRRCWQIYVAHVFLVFIFIGHITFVSQRYNNPLFSDEMGLAAFVADPYMALVQALILKFKPVNLDVLPLYVVLLAMFPAILWGMKRNPLAVLMFSASTYLLANIFDINLPGYPQGVWFFNPFAWQFLFVIGAFYCHTRGANPIDRLPPAAVLPFAAIYLGLSLFLVATWSNPSLAAYVPRALAKLIYPIDKTNLDILRLLHFLALAYLVVSLVRIDAAFLRWRALKPIVLCGQHSLHIFCLGAFLSFAGHFFLTEVNSSRAAQIFVSLLGIVSMITLAGLLAWYRRQESATRPPAPIPVTSGSSPEARS
ncbi:MAG: hypothetical protein A3G73_02755 [Rhodospirillales bacterium RIFCSPLOWO2_12_FULL_67_15]|nr:MAG: hypothetical protein A3G73_02755 [Rhodospirillales bacterium RIFCSPLOWO2_12_FULL_67_15]